jgi:predicted RNase H-like HicB family nuclease
MRIKVYNFPVIITQDEDGMFIGKVSTLPGCHTQAKNLADLYERMREAIELCIEVEREKRHSITEEKFIGVQQIEVSV